MRTPTTSVTELVKQLIKEELDKNAMEFERRVREDLSFSIETRLCNKLRVEFNECNTSITNAINRAGEAWTCVEEEQLHSEINTAIAQMAKNHGRSLSAIRTRLQRHIFGAEKE
jgi:hypothetical protein